MSYIPYPHDAGSSEQKATTSAMDASLARRCVRSAICGIAFGLPLGVIAPNSPLLQLSLMNDSAKRTVMVKMVMHFSLVGFAAASTAYYFILEPRISNPAAKRGWLPYLGPLTALVPGVCCLVASHVFYPGMWAIAHELTWRDRGRTFLRLTTKTLLAYAPVHLPAIGILSLLIGVVFTPFKLAKMRRGMEAVV